MFKLFQLKLNLTDLKKKIKKLSRCQRFFM